MVFARAQLHEADEFMLCAHHCCLEANRKCFGECIGSPPISDNDETSSCNHFCMGWTPKPMDASSLLSQGTYWGGGGCHCLRHSSKSPSDPHSFFRTVRPLRSGCSSYFSRWSVVCPVGYVFHCSWFFRLSWLIKQPLVGCTRGSLVFCYCLTLLRRNGCCIWWPSLLNGHSSWKKKIQNKM